MKLYFQIIKTLLKNYEQCMMIKNYKDGLWFFYLAYNICYAILRIEENFEDPKINIKNKLVSRIVRSPNVIGTKVFEKINKHMLVDYKVIHRAMMIIAEKEKEVADYELGEYYRNFTLGIVSPDHPAS